MDGEIPLSESEEQQKNEQDNIQSEEDEDPDIRKEIAQNGYDIVKSQHTYPIRLEQMLSLAYHQ